MNTKSDESPEHQQAAAQDGPALINGREREGELKPHALDHHLKGGRGGGRAHTEQGGWGEGGKRSKEGGGGGGGGGKR